MAKMNPDSHIFPLPLRGVTRRGEGCNRSTTIILVRASESHPPSLRDTSLEGGGLTDPHITLLISGRQDLF